MLDAWYTFPTQMGDHRAFITYNHGYAEIAKKDKRDFLLKVRVKIKNPTPAGMPTSEELHALSAVDERLDDSLTKNGAVYVGRITVDGHRYFHFYIDFPGQTASETIDNVSKQTTYKLQGLPQNLWVRMGSRDRPLAALAVAVLAFPVLW